MPTGVAQTAPQNLQQETFRVSVHSPRMSYVVSELQSRVLTPIKKVDPGRTVISELHIVLFHTP